MIKKTVEEALLAASDETWELNIKYDRSWILERVFSPEETLTSRIAEACNNIYLSGLQNFCQHFVPKFQGYLDGIPL